MPRFFSPWRGLRFVVASAIAALGLATPMAVVPATAGAVEPKDSVTFALTPGDSDPPGRMFQLRLRCGDQVMARATLVEPHASTRPLPQNSDRSATCTVSHRTKPQGGRVDEVTYTIRQGNNVLARRTLYSHDGRGRSTDFVVPGGRFGVDIAVESLPEDEVGTPLRMMAFNIWRGGRLAGNAGDDGGEDNFRQLIEFLRAKDPDVLFMVETYGSGEEILAGLNEGVPAGRRYQGVQVTREPGQDSDDDNLWLFTRLEVEEVYPPLAGGDLTSFNFGGARLGLPDGQHVHAFTTWLYHATFAPGLVNQSALESTLDLPRRYTDAELVDTDRERRLGMATTLLEERLETYIGDDDAPVFLGGDFNALSHLDWSERFADSFGHGGLVLDWPVMRMFDEAGFTDTYRWASPDAGRYPGGTYSPVHYCGYAECRIDYVLARGEDVRVLASHSSTRRLARHRGDELDAMFPFYSDHGAVVSDVLIRGEGRGPGPGYVPIYDDPVAADRSWPEAPPGTPVPPAELTATSTSENAGTGEAYRAVDGDLQTHWHSQYQPERIPQPHDITLDLQRVRTLSAVRYQPRVVGNLNGTILRAVVQVSEDGSDFRDVATVTWERDNLPKDVDLDGVRARYIRLHVELGINGHSSAAEITPYEQAERDEERGSP